MPMRVSVAYYKVFLFRIKYTNTQVTAIPLNHLSFAHVKNTYVQYAYDQSA